MGENCRDVLHELSGQRPKMHSKSAERRAISRFETPRLCHRSAGLVVRTTRDCAGERRSRGRQKRSWRLSRRSQADAPMDAPHHRLRRTIACTTSTRLTGAIRSRKCSGIGLAAAKARRWISSELQDCEACEGMPIRKSRVFTTTRPDTLFGATYMVLSPEHKLVDQITTPEQREAVAEIQN